MSNCEGFACWKGRKRRRRYSPADREHYSYAVGTDTSSKAAVGSDRGAATKERRSNQRELTPTGTQQGTARVLRRLALPWPPPLPSLPEQQHVLWQVELSTSLVVSHPLQGLTNVHVVEAHRGRATLLQLQEACRSLAAALAVALLLLLLCLLLPLPPAQAGKISAGTVYGLNQILTVCGLKTYLLEP